MIFFSGLLKQEKSNNGRRELEQRELESKLEILKQPKTESNSKGNDSDAEMNQLLGKIREVEKEFHEFKGKVSEKL